MPVSQEVAYNQLVNFIRAGGGQSSDWYCGITNNIETRVFGQHNVSRRNGCGQVTCFTNNCARNVENRLLGRGCDGGPGGGGLRTVHVYVYKKTRATVDR